MKKTIIISKGYADGSKEQVFAQTPGLVFSPNSSVIDLPSQIAEELINNNKVRFRVISWCMFPIIWAGDILGIEAVKPEDVKIGDIILYKSVGRAYAHRLVRTYLKENKLYIVTTGENEYRNNKFISNYEGNGGVSADNILGKVIEVKRGRLCFKPDEIKLSLGGIIKGRVKLSLWNLVYKTKQRTAKIFIKLQGFKLYRYFLRNFIKNMISFFAGISLIEKTVEINNLCFYRKFDDFSKDFGDAKGLYNISGRIHNWAVGNISLFFEEIDNRKICILSNFIIRIPFRGAGIASQLLEKTLYLCSKINVDEIKIVLSKGDEISHNLFFKLGFEII